MLIHKKKFIWAFIRINLSSDSLSISNNDRNWIDYNLTRGISKVS